MARATKRTVRKTENRRGSPEAVEKRRVARQFNALLAGGSVSGRLDGRTEKRRARLIKELKDGKARGGRILKPLDTLLRVDELLGIGETLGSLRKVVKTKLVADETDTDMVELLARLHNAYQFKTESYRVVGISSATLDRAGIGVEAPVAAAAPKRGRKKAA